MPASAGKFFPPFIATERIADSAPGDTRTTISACDMVAQRVPDDIRDFILEHIASVAQIEALLLIWATPEKRWGLSQIAARIYNSEAETAKALDGLCADGLLERKDETFGLNASEETVRIIGRLRETYARHLIPVTAVIHSKSRGSHSSAETGRAQGDR